MVAAFHHRHYGSRNCCRSARENQRVFCLFQSSNFFAENGNRRIITARIKWGFQLLFRAWFSCRLPTQSRNWKKNDWRVNRVVVVFAVFTKMIQYPGQFVFVRAHVAELAAKVGRRCVLLVYHDKERNFNSAAPWQTSFISQTIVAFDSLPAPAGERSDDNCVFRIM